MNSSTRLYWTARRLASMLAQKSVNALGAGSKIGKSLPGNSHCQEYMERMYLTIMSTSLNCSSATCCHACEAFLDSERTWAKTVRQWRRGKLHNKCSSEHSWLECACGTPFASHSSPKSRQCSAKARVNVRVAQLTDMYMYIYVNMLKQ
jgi:hypothetical protein